MLTIILRYVRRSPSEPTEDIPNKFCSSTEHTSPLSRLVLIESLSLRPVRSTVLELLIRPFVAYIDRSYKKHAAASYYCRLPAASQLESSLSRQGRGEQQTSSSSRNLTLRVSSLESEERVVHVQRRGASATTPLPLSSLASPSQRSKGRQPRPRPGRSLNTVLRTFNSLD